MWPDRTRNDLYRARNLYPPARWSQEPFPISQVTRGDGVHPRRSVGPDDTAPDKQPFYWCRSCNRLVPNSNRPFCDKHQEPRRRFMRRLNDTHTVPVSRRAVDRVLEVNAALLEARSRFDEATDIPAQNAAWVDVKRAIAAMGPAMADLRQAQPQIRTDDIDDADFQTT